MQDVAEQIGERLRQAVERHPDLSIRKFQQAMDEYDDVKGTTYATVHSYLSGKTTPSLEFLEVAAEVLDVPRRWLVLGEGSPSDVEEGLEKAEEGAGEPPDLTDGRVLREKLIDQLETVRRLPRPTQLLFIELVRAYADACPDFPVQDEAAYVQVADRIDGLIHLPLALPGFKKVPPRAAKGEGHLKHGAWANYVSLQLAALLHAVQAPGRGPRHFQIAKEEIFDESFPRDGYSIRAAAQSDPS